MRTDLTVVYRTSNRERPEFEACIQQTLLKTIGDLPLISVSQQPITLGRNICVGDVGVSNVNNWRQLQIGAQAATTKYVCTAEADFLHAPDYFDFVPPDDWTLYVPSPIYVLFVRKRNRLLAWPKHGCQGAVIADRQFLLECIARLLEEQPEWTTAMRRDAVALGIFYQTRWDMFDTAVPTITFKTDCSMHESTGVGRPAKDELPYWGKVEDLVAEYRVLA